MREAERTTRRRIADALREEPATPSELAATFDLTPEAATRHVEHVARSVDGDGEQLLVAPPVCRECGFEEFDDLLNRPSRCPECKSEAIEEPTFTIEPA
ncbi:transcriptional regulator [Natrialbaceae archaeon AArc-T1-2]|uniref:transcriptional regulator n=1 Tax=Natrialbaceae archaeon AArc-T1-2 TaxID=3053904 RepID=UPI00255A7880|nr:helix-turn-helix domain-containing protein [Natrialbaceae archaeon AArc-T1-2]WIV66029.1 transcriptional regulator [Natrialbaceae archaeon AArc-T1-2]